MGNCIKGACSLFGECVLYYFNFLGDATDALFAVVNSGANAGSVSVTGVTDRETETTFTMNIRVSCSFIHIIFKEGESCLKRELGETIELV